MAAMDCLILAERQDRPSRLSQAKAWVTRNNWDSCSRSTIYPGESSPSTFRLTFTHLTGNEYASTSRAHQRDYWQHESEGIRILAICSFSALRLWLHSKQGVWSPILMSCGYISSAVSARNTMMSCTNKNTQWHLSLLHREGLSKTQFAHRCHAC